MAGEAERRSEWPLALAGAVAIAGLVILTFYDWRDGVLVFAGGVGLAALLRAVLSDSAAGLLHVRGRMFDTLLLVGVGAAILLLGLIVPN
ncbi:hypothetical protein GCM10009789_09070 [Kribbella sancticallisti]|uniref:DUF3017 domain-containing protein n=1 Tax=Kribbella sancticallisti TaxID=460087 RepID=A0ABP4N8S3_9ACTN